jgi:hypothetical protein
MPIKVVPYALHRWADFERRGQMADFRIGSVACSIEPDALVVIGTDEDGHVRVAALCGDAPRSKQALAALAEQMLQTDGITHAAIIRAECIFSKSLVDRHVDGRQTTAPPLIGGRQSVFFDSELCELWVHGTLVKRLDRRATSQIRILTALQEDDWPNRVDDPLRPNGGDEKARLRSVIHCLNTRQRPFSIRFFADGSGQGIRWEFVQALSSKRPKR